MNTRRRLFGGALLVSSVVLSLGAKVRAQSAAQAPTDETSQSEKAVSTAVQTSPLLEPKANANAAAANANAAAANANAAAAYANYTIGEIVPHIPTGCATPVVNGITYYLCGNMWFSASYGANGVYYRVSTTP
jgi:hypothetical protein